MSLSILKFNLIFLHFLIKLSEIFMIVNLWLWDSSAVIYIDVVISVIPNGLSCGVWWTIYLWRIYSTVVTLICVWSGEWIIVPMILVTRNLSCLTTWIIAWVLLIVMRFPRVIDFERMEIVLSWLIVVLRWLIMTLPNTVTHTLVECWSICRLLV